MQKSEPVAALILETDWVPKSYLSDSWQPTIPYPSSNELMVLADRLTAARSGLTESTNPWAATYWTQVLSTLETRWNLMTSHLELSIARGEMREQTYAIRYDWLGHEAHRFPKWLNFLATFYNDFVTNCVDRHS